MNIYKIENPNMWKFVVANTIEEALDMYKKACPNADVARSISLIAKNPILPKIEDKMDEYRENCKNKLKKELNTVIENFNY